GLKHEIVTLPSVSTLAVLRRELAGRKPAPKAVAVLADPVFDAQDERLKIAKTLKASGRQQVPLRTSVASETRAADLLRSAAESGVAAESLRIPRLPFTRQQADAIAGLAPASRRKEATDFAA